MECGRHVACMAQLKNAHIFLRKPGWKSS